MFLYYIKMVNAWISHLKQFWSKNKGKMTYKQAMKEAKKTYTPTGSKVKVASKAKSKESKKDKMLQDKLERDFIIQKGLKDREREGKLEKLGITKDKQKELKLIKELEDSVKKGGSFTGGETTGVKMQGGALSANRSKIVRKYTDYKKSVQEGLRKGILKQKDFNHFISLAKSLAKGSKTNKYAKDYKKIEKEFKSKKYIKLLAKKKDREPLTKIAQKNLNNLERLMEMDTKHKVGQESRAVRSNILSNRKQEYVRDAIRLGTSKENAEKKYKNIAISEEKALRQQEQQIKALTKSGLGVSAAALALNKFGIQESPKKGESTIPNSLKSFYRKDGVSFTQKANKTKAKLKQAFQKISTTSNINDAINELFFTKGSNYEKINKKPYVNILFNNTGSPDFNLLDIYTQGSQEYNELQKLLDIAGDLDNIRDANINNNKVIAPTTPTTPTPVLAPVPHVKKGKGKAAPPLPPPLPKGQPPISASKTILLSTRSAGAPLKPLPPSPKGISPKGFSFAMPFASATTPTSPITNLPGFSTVSQPPRPPSPPNIPALYGAASSPVVQPATSFGSTITSAKPFKSGNQKGEEYSKVVSDIRLNKFSYQEASNLGLMSPADAGSVGDITAPLNEPDKIAVLDEILTAYSQDTSLLWKQPEGVNAAKFLKDSIIHDINPQEVDDRIELEKQAIATSLKDKVLDAGIDSSNTDTLAQNLTTIHPKVVAASHLDRVKNKVSISQMPTASNHTRLLKLYFVIEMLKALTEDRRFIDKGMTSGARPTMNLDPTIKNKLVDLYQLSNKLYDSVLGHNHTYRQHNQDFQNIKQEFDSLSQELLAKTKAEGQSTKYKFVLGESNVLKPYAESTKPVVENTEIVLAKFKVRAEAFGKQFAEQFLSKVSGGLALVSATPPVQSLHEILVNMNSNLNEKKEPFQSIDEEFYIDLGHFQPQTHLTGAGFADGDDEYGEYSVNKDFNENTSKNNNDDSFDFKKTSALVPFHHDANASKAKEIKGLQMKIMELQNKPIAEYRSSKHNIFKELKDLGGKVLSRGEEKDYMRLSETLKYIHGKKEGNNRKSIIPKVGGSFLSGVTYKGGFLSGATRDADYHEFFSKNGKHVNVI
mgnify:CR=1 FL=1